MDIKYQLTYPDNAIPWENNTDFAAEHQIIYDYHSVFWGDRFRRIPELEINSQTIAWGFFDTSWDEYIAFFQKPLENNDVAFMQAANKWHEYILRNDMQIFVDSIPPDEAVIHPPYPI